MTLNEAKQILHDNGMELIKEELDINTLEFPQSSAYGFLHNECGLDWEPKDTDKYSVGLFTRYTTTLPDGRTITVSIDYEGWVVSVRLENEKTAIPAQDFIDMCKAG